MSIHAELLDREIADLKQFTKIDNESEAVAKAAREFLRLSRLRELKAISGKVEYTDSWRQLEELELRATDFPR